jgi:hypothetical protein
MSRTLTGKRVLYTMACVALLILLLARLAAPELIRRNLNRYLATFSPVYAVAIGDLSLAIWRGAYRLENVTGNLKDNSQRFLKAESVDVSLAWRELFQGRLSTDILVEGADLALTRELFDSSAGESKDASRTDHLKQRAAEGKEVTNKLFPLRIERVAVRNTTLEFAEVAKLPPELRWVISSINGEISNLTPKSNQPFALLSLNGTVMDSAELKLVGKADRLAQPLSWEVDAQLLNFSLARSNPLLLRLVPLNFATGTVDIYAEALDQNKQITGYVKPFLKNVQVMQKDQKFENFHHALNDYFAAILNLILRTPNKKIVAAKIPFAYKGAKFSVDKSTFLTTIIQNGFGGPLQPGIEDKFNLEFPNRSAAVLKNSKLQGAL